MLQKTPSAPKANGWLTTGPLKRSAGHYSKTDLSCFSSERSTSLGTKLLTICDAVLQQFLMLDKNGGPLAEQAQKVCSM